MSLSADEYREHLATTAVRAGFNGSGVARSNRLLERCRAMWRQPTHATPLESLSGDA